MSHDGVIARLIQFYSLPELHPRQVKHTRESVTTQVFSTSRLPKTPRPTNYFNNLYVENDLEVNIMDRDSDSTDNQKPTITPWATDARVDEISHDLFSQIQKAKTRAKDAGETEPDGIEYKNPTNHISPAEKISQQIRFNLIRHRGTLAGIPSLKLCKSFITTL